MRPVYIHNNSAYVILRQKPIHYFATSFEEAPNMEHVQMFMKAVGADHVLRTQSHFMFCETVTDTDFENIQ